MINIYYIEDDIDISQAVKEYLEKHGYKVSVFNTIKSAKQALENMCPSLVLADWNMPDGTGSLFCQWIRSKLKDLPVIFITVRSDTGDIVKGFENGADDYIVKPFELEVLLLRITALLRRTGNVSRQYLSCGGIFLDQNRMLVFLEGEQIDLSPQEYQLLLYLLQNKGRIVTREKLLENIWDINGNYVNDNTLTVTIKRLRQKLKKPACIKTVRSIGYIMENL